MSESLYYLSKYLPPIWDESPVEDRILLMNEINKNAAKWKKQDGGSMNMDQVYDLSNEQIQNLINQGYEIQYV